MLAAVAIDCKSCSKKYGTPVPWDGTEGNKRWETTREDRSRAS
jgi:hypothetical protein